MVTHEVKPDNEGQPRPGRGKMTWIGAAAIVVFLVLIALVVLRPIVDRHDGPETEAARVVQPTATQNAPG